MAANSTAGFATGSAECCVCPLCKAIAAARNPDPDLAERLATGAGNLAAGVASFLRGFSPAREPGGPASEERGGPAEGPGGSAEEPGGPAEEPGGSAQEPGDSWHAATHKTSTTDSDVAQD
ncbi:hypothetical protein [Dactylosporangium sp. NPDC049140]|uniref:hypothetical protein n=1 Tax=Dactylosporangium sp. NPDC049140 TaxID=3155647 RepID=UPI0033CBE3BB